MFYFNAQHGFFFLLDWDSIRIFAVVDPSACGLFGATETDTNKVI